MSHSLAQEIPASRIDHADERVTDGYWLRYCHGFHVDTPAVDSVFVENVLYGANHDGPAALAVLGGLFRPPARTRANGNGRNNRPEVQAACRPSPRAVIGFYNGREAAERGARRRPSGERFFTSLCRLRRDSHPGAVRRRRLSAPELGRAAQA